MEPMQPMKPMKAMGHGETWWPADLGEPSASGSANAFRYAYFADRGRLAVDDGQSVQVYDTGGKRISGFHSSGGKELGFDTEDGPATVRSLKTA